MQKAKTYYSTNGWTSPQSLSQFGIPIIRKNEIRHLGLEEFNFTPLLKKNKLAFIPAFSKIRAEVIDELFLFYCNNGCTFHYATMYDVSQIQNNPQVINLIRQNELSHLPNLVSNDIQFQQNYGNLFQQAMQIWNQNYNSNNIIAEGVNPRFVVNVQYEKLLIHNPLRQVPWNNLKRANCLFL
jgi:hypothetical protein